MKGIESHKYRPTDIANWFLCHIDREAGDAITHLKLQKLLYYAQAWCIVLSGKSLFEDDFEAWSHGPVLPGIYNEFKRFGFEALPSCDCENAINADVENILSDVQRVYGEKSAKYLEELTHREAPWIEARNGLPLEVRCSNVISKEDMRRFYSAMLQENEGRKSGDRIPDSAINKKDEKTGTLLTIDESKIFGVHMNMHNDPYVNLKYFDSNYECLGKG